MTIFVNAKKGAANVDPVHRRKELCEKTKTGSNRALLQAAILAL
ncbi:MAG: hypothetical protein ACJAYG_001172 [Oceanicoccus sp.]|jgi:hypothetical protein